MVRRIFVEKQEAFAVEAKELYQDIKENLHIYGLSDLRVINRYDIEGIDQITYDSAKYTVFAEPSVDQAYDEIVPVDRGSYYFAVEYLPGQYDQRSDSAEQCIRLINIEAKATVRFARMIILEGNLSPEEFSIIKSYCINPVDSREARLEKPEKLEISFSQPENIKIISGFIDMNEDQLKEYWISQGFAMSYEDLKFIKEYFAETEQRDPTVTEVKVIDTYWSDHCRHTTFFTNINSISFEKDGNISYIQEALEEYMKVREDVYGDRKKDISLMDLAVIGAKYLKKKGYLNDLDESEEINACSIKVKARIDDKDEDWLVMFKNETHNHPTEIEPFGGAATCLGGAIRDPLSGRVYVYQAMRVTGSGDPRASVEDTLPGKLPQRKISKGAAKGYSSYGNQIGLATGQVSEVYHQGYLAKRMEVGAVIGAAPAENVRREKPREGDLIILLGGRTGRDGIGGATGSSKEQTEDSIWESGAEVQKGNPPVERNLQRLFRRKEAAQLIKRCNDFGAGGVSVAIGELADSIDVNLDKVLKKYEGLDGTELAISESQERMAVVVSAENHKDFIKFAEEENLEALVVAKVTDTGRFRMFWKENCILDLSRKFLDSNGVKQEAQVYISGAGMAEQNENELDIRKELQNLNTCSQKGLVEMFDSTIGTATVLMPLGGTYQLSPQLGMAAKLPVLEGYTDTTTLMAYGYDPDIAMESPFHGALYAVIDSVTKIVAMGGDYSKIRLTFQEYFERLGKDPEKWAKPFTALLGALKAQLKLGIPSIGGKDSMSGTFMDLSVPPALISFAVATVDANHVISTELKRPTSHLVYLFPEKDKDQIIDFANYKTNMAKVRELALKGKILAANTVGKGGVFISLVKMMVGNKIGAEIFDIDSKELCKPNYGSLIVEIDKRENLDELFLGVHYRLLGETKEKPEITVLLTDRQTYKASTIQMSLDKIIEDWMAPLEGIFPSRTNEIQEKSEEIKITPYKEPSNKKATVKHAKPRVLIPVFPGSNCEVDSKLAFERAGAVVDLQIFRNLDQKVLRDSIKEMVKYINKSQIIMIPGGFSGGDEPDGSAKFITAIFRNPEVKEAVTEFLEKRDGLMLGICNGFQALIKLGLVPYGKIIEPDAANPTLTYNKIGRHVSCLVRTKIISVKSPWMSKVEVGDIHTIPVSHGEGRFIASQKILSELKENGQIITQYVDLKGLPSTQTPYNPNGSDLAIEGITSLDGRILGKMGHSERIGKNLYKNIQGNFDQKIFESGVDYFR